MAVVFRRSEMADLGPILKQRLPRRLIRLREIHGLSQKALAERAGIGTSTVNEIESGLAGDIMLSTLIHISGALEASLDALLGFDQVKDRADIGDAVFIMAVDGATETAIATRFGLPVAAIAKILEEEHEARRLRRFR